MNNKINMGNVYEHVRESIGTFRGTSRKSAGSSSFYVFFKAYQVQFAAIPYDTFIWLGEQGGKAKNKRTVLRIWYG